MINKKYSRLLNEIVDDSIKNVSEHTDMEIDDFFRKYKIMRNDHYAYFLKHYGNDYIKDGYCYHAKSNRKTPAKKYEMDMLFGLGEGSGNIREEIESNKDMLPDFVIPVSAMAGGDFVCMDKNNGGIYFWFHEKETDNLVFAEKDFEKFILRFHKADENNDVIRPKAISIDAFFDALLKAEAKKYM